jgi:hypothetical protein
LGIVFRCGELLFHIAALRIAELQLSVST